MVDLVAMQKEQIEWSERNFGKQHARYPLLGMIEETLEFDEAWKKLNEAMAHDTVFPEERATLDAALLDTIGDIGIYMLDYCGKKGLSLADLWNTRLYKDGGKWWDLTPYARAFAHHQLKGEQGIRGTPEAHDADIALNCRYVLDALDKASHYLGKDFPSIVEAVWSKVRQRDWVKNKANAHQVAEQTVIDMTNAAGNTDP